MAAAKENKNLIIVESPTKVTTIKKFLGNNYEVVASQGHVIDLPKSSLGIDIDNDFEPKYITIRGKGPLLAQLKKDAKKAETVYLATDPDREGEAISWHLAKALGIEDSAKRITFNEITKTAVKDAISHPSHINKNLVDAQQARRVLDRIVGYKISPLLWAKIKRGLSAGRVQSAALRLICDREAEIDSFISEEYWTIDATFAPAGAKNAGSNILAHLIEDKSGKLNIKNKASSDAIVSDLQGACAEVSSIKKGKKTKKAPFAFTTSTLQQEAAKQLGFATKKTMQIAQQLYEGINIKGKGRVGMITYLRTDSIRVSDEAAARARAYIAEHFGREYIGGGSTKTSGKAVQDAHEAIRPADINLSPVIVKESLSRDQFRLYQLIWQRFVASRMKNAEYETISVKITAKDYVFTSSGQDLTFPGFLTVYKDDEEKKEKTTSLKKLKEGEELDIKNLSADQHFTQPPPHFTEASLVKTLEENGIGRPSTYAPTITTLLARRYIVREKKNLYVSELGEAVNDMLKQAFPDVVDIKFTSDMEETLDEIADGKIDWKEPIRDYYPTLERAVEKAEKDVASVKLADEVSDVICENCGRNMVVKYGPSGKFLACPGFPECRNTKPLYEKTGVACPKCGKDIVVRRTKKGRTFYGCAGYPECDFSSWQKPSKKPCPVCGGIMVIKGKKLACINPACGHIEDTTKTSKKAKSAN